VRISAYWSILSRPVAFGNGRLRMRAVETRQSPRTSPWELRFPLKCRLDAVLILAPLPNPPIAERLHGPQFGEARLSPDEALGLRDQACAFAVISIASAVMTAIVVFSVGLPPALKER
jgi:hypothetical protein